jgi:oligogalacturonide lyase
MLQLTEAAALDGSSVTLIPGDRSFCYFDGDSLRLAAFSNLRDREVCHLREGWGRGRGFSVSRDGAFGLFVETKGDSWQIRQNWFAKQSAATVLDSRAALSHPIPRPKGDGVLFRREDGSLWVCGSDGQHERSCPRVPGTAGQAFWAPDGKSVLYLHFPEDRSVLNSIREWEPDSGAERLVSKTSQFVQFALNADASIFAGASTSKASPNILLLHRGTRRELTICEHRASDASRTSPVFSPDSQRLFFQSDRDGKPAIYCMIVDRLVERTEE